MPVRVPIRIENELSQEFWGGFLLGVSFIVVMSWLQQNITDEDINIYGRALKMWPDVEERFLRILLSYFGPLAQIFESKIALNDATEAADLCKRTWNPFAPLYGAEYSRMNIHHQDNYMRLQRTAEEDEEAYAVYDVPNAYSLDKDVQSAQQMVRSACGLRSIDQRIELAHAALKISKHTPSAYILLAEEQATTVSEAVELFIKASDASVRYLDKVKDNYINTSIKQVWKVTETRPYIHAQMRLSTCYRKLGRWADAIRIAKKLVEYPLVLAEKHALYLLIDAYVAAGKYTECEDVFRKYRDQLDCTCLGYYMRPLMQIARRKEPFSYKKAKAKGINTADVSVIRNLVTAMEFNSFAAQYILRDEPLVLPAPYITPRHDFEAQMYAFQFGYLWWKIDGAIEMFRCARENGFGEITQTERRFALPNMLGANGINRGLTLIGMERLPLLGDTVLTGNETQVLNYIYMLVGVGGIALSMACVVNTTSQFDWFINGYVF